MVKNNTEKDPDYQTARQLMDKGAAVFELDKGIKLFVTLNYGNSKWAIDTYLFGESEPICYSVKGKNKLKELATDGQFSDGVLQVEKNDGQGFALLFVDDLASSFVNTVLTWIAIIKGLVGKKEYISHIKTNWKKHDPRIWS